MSNTFTIKLFFLHLGYKYGKYYFSLSDFYKEAALFFAYQLLTCAPVLVASYLPPRLFPLYCSMVSLFCEHTED